MYGRHQRPSLTPSQCTGPPPTQRGAAEVTAKTAARPGARGRHVHGCCNMLPPRPAASLSLIFPVTSITKSSSRFAPPSLSTSPLHGARVVPVLASRAAAEPTEHINHQ
ncbi:hypothetical protein E2C01_005639 [Portunus trituberculatus]|uniref:Uncharacterized protein n=1 Tax=Portunus trituberculatus TaxID=210409 RepID=A0A5B7CZN9_PORTR|nr:hypothetical protein [Portunus trituberculatus]